MGASGLNSKGQTMSPSPMPPILKVEKHASPRPISPAVEFKKTSSVGPGPFPTTIEPTSSHQNPPKRVDVLMTEMSQYDPTIQISTESNSRNHEDLEIDQQDCIKVLPKDVTPEPDQPSQKGAPSAVYYPPGDLYSADSQQSEPILTERKKKDRSDKKTRNDGDYGNTQGAAVVPICLPLCCAAPCVSQDPSLRVLLDELLSNNWVQLLTAHYNLHWQRQSVGWDHLDFSNAREDLDHLLLALNSLGGDGNWDVPGAVHKKDMLTVVDLVVNSNPM